MKEMDFSKITRESHLVEVIFELRAEGQESVICGKS